MALVRVVIVLGLLWLVMRIIRRVSGRAHGGGVSRTAKSTLSIELINRRAIGRSASVAAVRVGTKMYVLGITDQNIEKLDVCDVPEFGVGDLEFESRFASDMGVDALGESNGSHDPSDQGSRRRHSLLDSLRERTVR